MAKAHLPVRCLSGFSLQLNFFLSAVSSTFHFFHGFSDEFYDFIGYLIHFRIIYYPGLQDYIIGHFVANLRQVYIFPQRLALLKDVPISAQ